MDANDTIDAIWCVDSESGDELLLDMKTGNVIARRDRSGNITHERAN